MKKIMLAVLSTMALAFLMFSVSAAFSAPNANAAGAQCANKAGCLSLADDWGGSGTQGGGGGGLPPVSGNGGLVQGTAKPKPIPCIGSYSDKVSIETDASAVAGGWKKVTTGCVAEYTLKTKWTSGVGVPGVSWSIDWKCPPMMLNGFLVNAKGYYTVTKRTVSFGVSKEGGGIWYIYISQPSTTMCVYPKVTTSSKVVKCAVSSTVYLDRADSFLGPSRLQTMSKTVGSKTKVEKQGLCETDISFAEIKQVNPNINKNWGNYQMSGSIKWLRCVVGTESFEGSSRKLYKCGNVQTTAAVTSKMSLYCNGNNPSGWSSGKTWTVQDCDKGRGWTCSVPTATYDGKTGLVQTLRDGKSRSINWGTPKLTGGVRASNNWNYKNTVVTGSTPYNTAVGINDKKKQLFYSTQTFGSWAKKANAAGANSQGIGFYNASNPGGKFEMKRESKFKAEFRVVISGIKRYSPMTGAVSLTSQTKWQADTSRFYTCPIQSSPKIQAIRTIGDAN